MFAGIRDWILPHVIGFAPRRIRKLKFDEEMQQMTYAGCLSMGAKPRTTSVPIIVAMVGLVGSGKSTVAREFARHTNMLVVEADDVRANFQSKGFSLDRIWAITENIALDMASRGANVIIDSDFIHPFKRASLLNRTREMGINVFFVRVICDPDVMFSRLRGSDAGAFFNGASSKSTAEDKGRDVRLRDLWRRTPLHYLWKNKGGGCWTPRELSFELFAEIDTTDHESMYLDIKVQAEELMDMY
jgi:predicted kinase